MNFSLFFLDKGAEKYDPMDIFTEYMVKALGHANQKIVKDYATRSGEALDWMLAELDPDYVAKYAHAVNYKGNKHFQNPCSHSYYYVGMTQWRDTGTETNTNNNMWPYTVRLLQQKAVEKGCEYIYGAQGLTLVHDDGKVTGAIFTDIDGKYFQVNADAVIVAAGDFGGNPSGGLCQHAAVCTDGEYRVLTGAKAPIPGLYAVGNCCGQRYGVQYHTPTAGNSCGSAFATGYLAAEYVKNDLDNGIGGENSAEERTTNGKYYAGTYTSSKNSSYSTVTVTMTFSEDAITDCKITSSGNEDLMKDDLRSSMAAAVVESQGDTSVDAITSSTLSFSVKAVQEAVADCIAQAKA